VAGATITARNLDTGVRRTTQTNVDGFYRFSFLPIGPYEVQAQKSGFANELLRVTLTVGDTVTANFGMKLPGLVEKVEVSSLATQVDTSTSQTEQPVSQPQTAARPMTDRSSQRLAKLI